MSLFIFYVGWVVLALALCGGIYTVATALLAARLLRRAPDPAPTPLPAVTVLKPLHGAEPGLDAALASVLTQAYAAPVQLVLGLHAADDPAHAVAQRLKDRFPDRDIAIVVDPRVHGSNLKISNVINMMPQARHDVLVLADSDITAGPGWLQAVVAGLHRPGVGVVSCLYAGSGLTTAWSRLAAMDVSYRFLPNAIFGISSGLAHPCFGSTIALSRDTLSTIGGFEAFADFLADDFEIGRAVRARGLAIHYPPLTVSHGSTETTFGALIGQELRWARTIRVIDPLGHWGSALTHALPLGLVGALLLTFSPAACVVLVLLLVARLSLKRRLDHIVGASAGPFWFLPVRDMVSFGLFIVSLFGRTVDWRGKRLRIGKSGAMSSS
ncbi:MAG TPA: bacteriohopanetetrol glucosamine biosynthesis glycosyltransferase HpnI [Vineibacter sp.]|nr:bacteriohopanetetrol glucosamine biosynthesis glycosyltransferase HpnI [Vineibacter sp.]